jgi:heme/copper-type cytochrome/quinol oxidase subunit 2
MNETEEVPVAEPKKSNSTTITITLIALGVVGLLLVRNTMGSKNTAKVTPTATPKASMQPAAMTTSPAPASESESQKMTGETMMISDPTQVETIKMDMGAFYYKPAVIKVKKGQKIRIELTSKDMMHDFNIDALQVKSPIVKAGETATVEFVADQVGEFEYYCSVGQHRKNGQVGTLIVEE